jgi:hypothetical protein
LSAQVIRFPLERRQEQIAATRTRRILTVPLSLGGLATAAAAVFLVAWLFRDLRQ